MGRTLFGAAAVRTARTAQLPDTIVAKDISNTAKHTEQFQTPLNFGTLAESSGYYTPSKSARKHFYSAPPAARAPSSSAPPEVCAERPGGGDRGVPVPLLAVALAPEVCAGAENFGWFGERWSACFWVGIRQR